MMTSNNTVWCLVLAVLVVSSCSTIKPPRETWNTKSSQPYNDVVRLVSVQAEKCWTKSGGWSHDAVVVEYNDTGAYYEVTARRNPRDISLDPFIRVRISRAGGPTRVAVLEGEYAGNVLGLTAHVKDWMAGRRACKEFQN